MDLKYIFVQNLRKFRKTKGISQMELAEKCDTAPNYIANIEIGRRFPSLKLIEKISKALEVEPYCFFIEDSGEHLDKLESSINLITKLPEKQRLEIINRISIKN
jgi:transcriptional regulator with XRE-family HTH domain